MVMAFGAFSAVAAPAGAVAPSIADVVRKDIGPEIRAHQPNPAELKMAASGMPGSYASADVYQVGAKAEYFVSTYGTSTFMEFEKRGEGANVEIWVATDLSFPAGDPRNVPSKTTIYDWQVEFLINEYETVILPTESDYFGVADVHTGANEIITNVTEGEEPAFQDDSGRLMIMVFNMVDESFYDSTYPNYIVGYYSPSIEYYYDRNVIHLDSYDWMNRLGSNVSRPFVYDSTVAHEYQHLLHDDLDADEVSFINEGCSMYAEMLCGYGEPWDYIAQFLYTPDNSLTEWGDQGDINIIADYGAAAMFMIYMSDHFGGPEFVSALAANTDNGEAGVTSTLAEFGIPMTFDDVFHDWTLANLIHSNDFGDGKYNYVSIDLNNPLAGDLMVHKIKPGMGFVTASYAFQWTYSLDGYNTLTYLLGPYATDYMKIQGLRVGEMPRLNFKFDGNDLFEPGWKLVAAPAVPGMAGNAWYSGLGDQKDISFVSKEPITVVLGDDGNATLSFDTWYAIEEQWDFGFVQVSTDGGATWTSLANEYTRSDIVADGYPAIIPNMPGFTGSGQGHMVFDLSAYADQQVLIAFRYMTDWSTTEQGWYVDNVALNGVVVDDGDTVRSFESMQPPMDVNFTVTIYAPAYANDEVSLPYKMVRMSLDGATETGLRSMADFAAYKDIYILVSDNAGPTNYKFGLLKA